MVSRVDAAIDVNAGSVRIDAPVSGDTKVTQVCVYRCCVVIPYLLIYKATTIRTKSITNSAA